ncbi:MAG: hypothetical protein U9Q78_08950 [Chloroflexota bacterium]|nr:hypothetical protein [Chloroflexota bacterium]
MNAVEITWMVLIIAFGIIGIVRGFLRELGVTMVLLIVLYAFDHWGEDISGLVFKGVERAMGVPITGEPREDLAKAAFYITAIFIAAFISYHGETLAFQGTPPKGIAGVLLALIIGLVNGYLVAGTMWFYLNKFDYPFGLVSKPLTPLARHLIGILPLAVLSPYLPFLVVFMVIARVIR